MVMFVHPHVLGPSITQKRNLSLGTVLVDHVDMTESVGGL